MVSALRSVAFLVPLKAQVGEDVCAHIVIDAADLDGDVGACERAWRAGTTGPVRPGCAQSLQEGIALRHQ